MKLIDEFKEKVEAVESDMEKKAIIARAGMLLTDDELTEVSGGITIDVAYVIIDGARKAYEHNPRVVPSFDSSCNLLQP